MIVPIALGVIALAISATLLKWSIVRLSTWRPGMESVSSMLVTIALLIIGGLCSILTIVVGVYHLMIN